MNEMNFNKRTLLLAACFIPLFFIFGCNWQNKQEQLEHWKEEVVKTENAFAEMAEKEGIKEAFLHFADEDAVLNRNNKIISGINEINDYLNQTDYTNMQLKWEPEFVDVAASGDLAYTYGSFTFTVNDSTGSVNEVTGVFHTVWKRQEDGNWKYVWD